MKVSPLAGKVAEASLLVNVPRLITAYYTETPYPSVPAQRVLFGTSGGPLFLGMDTHALSVPALATALEVLAANGLNVMLAERDEYSEHADACAGQRRAYRRVEGGHAKRMVRCAAFRDREHLQDLRGELPGRRTSSPYPGGGPSHGKRGLGRGIVEVDVTRSAHST